MLAICSIFSNSANYLSRYFDQLEWIKGEKYYLWLEGNSTDNTYATLENYLKNKQGRLFKQDVGRIYGSVENKERFQQLADLWNILIENIPEDATEVLFVESDLVWSTQVKDLLTQLPKYGFVCPLVQKDSFFYDIWAYRYLDGSRFSANLISTPKKPTEIKSAGSMLLIQKQFLGNAKLDSEAFVGLCNNIDKELTCFPITVYHP